MTIQAVMGADATSANFAALPPRLAHAGYTTGNAGIPWTAAQWAADPTAVHIDQTPAHTAWDATADVDDYERGAVLLSELAPRAKLRMSAFRQATRPGQRIPAVYADQSNITDVVNALIAGGVHSGVGLWVAHWGITESEALSMVEEASGPFPVIGVQYENGTEYDYDVFSEPWLNNVSHQAGHLYWHTVDKMANVGELAAARGYPSALSWLAHQEALQSVNAERLAAGAEVLPGAQWVSVNP